MSICLATKGVICPAPLIIPQRTPYSPILKFDVALILDKPVGLLVENSGMISKPKIFRVTDSAVFISRPKGFEVEGEEPISIPSGFRVSDEDYVSAPSGFAVEDI